MKIKIWSDGAARGNPGPAGAGALLEDAAGKTLAELSEYLGETTNNVAEYRALEIALREALRHGARQAEIFLDSELVVRQLQGLYRVRQPHLLPLFSSVQQLLKKFSGFSIQHVPREQNRRADQLANQAIDGHHGQ
jgi:ribonuclease HI